MPDKTFSPGSWAIWRRRYHSGGDREYHKDIPVLIIEKVPDSQPRYSCFAMKRLPDGELVKTTVRGEGVLLETPGIERKPQIQTRSLMSLDEWMHERRYQNGTIGPV